MHGFALTGMKTNKKNNFLIFSVFLGVCGIGGGSFRFWALYRDPPEPPPKKTIILGGDWHPG